MMRMSDVYGCFSFLYLVITSVVICQSTLTRDQDFIFKLYNSLTMSLHYNHCLMFQTWLANKYDPTLLHEMQLYIRR